MIRFIEDKDEKRKISREILESLTEWFEVEESREQYIRESADQPFWAYFDNDVQIPSTFLLLPLHQNIPLLYFPQALESEFRH